MNQALIAADNIWVLWAILAGWAYVSIWLEQKYNWASKITGAIIALIGAMALSNFGIIPTESPVYDTVWTYVVPMAIPMLLYQANIKKIWRESGRMLGIYLIGAMATCIGVVIAFFAIKNFVPDLYKVAAMICGSYIGGGVNFVAMSEAFGAAGEVVSATIVADNMVMAMYFFILMTIPTMAIFRKLYKHPHVDAVESNVGADENLASKYWQRKEISLKDIAFAFGSAVVIVAVSIEIAKFFAGVIPTDNEFTKVLNSLLGNKYLMITTLTMLLATFMPKTFGDAKGSQEIGTFLIYLFFVVIGVPASIPQIIQNSPILLVFCMIVVLINLAIMLFVGRLFKFDLEEILIASNANIGGPTTAAAMAISKGWTKLVAPAMLVGVLGYIIGNYLAIIVGNMLSKL